MTTLDIKMSSLIAERSTMKTNNYAMIKLATPTEGSATPVSLKAGALLDAEADGSFKAETATDPTAVLLEDITVDTDGTVAPVLLLGTVYQEGLSNATLTDAMKLSLKEKGIFVREAAND